MFGKPMWRTAGSLVALTVLTVACSPLAHLSFAAPSGPHGSARHQEKMAAKWFGRHDLARALPAAENAVAMEPRNVTYRVLLARIYTAEGRYQSAEQTWRDVMDLGQVDAHAVIGDAMAMLAQNRAADARALLDAHANSMPAADYGLALALAGDSHRGVEVLSEAIRSQGADARVRQNLALAYALDGRWREARLMAAQDMPQSQVDARIAQWAELARPDAYSARVASIMGAAPRFDAGQPVRLALNPADRQNAAATPAPDAPSVAVAAADTPLPAVGPAPADGGQVDFRHVATEPQVTVASVSAPATAPAPVPAPAPVAKPRTAITPIAVPASVAVAAVPPSPVARASVPGRRSARGTIQLGAFSTRHLAQSAWRQYQGRYAVLHDYRSEMTTVRVRGRVLVRLIAVDPGDRLAAGADCSRIHAAGGLCLVRLAVTHRHEGARRLAER